MGSRNLFKRCLGRRLGRGRLIVAVAMLFTAPTFAAEPAASAPQSVAPVSPELRLGLELNKLEQRGEDCAIWMVLQNKLDTDLEELKLDLVFFDAGGLIQRRLALDAAPLAAGKTTVKVFKVPDMRCESIGRMLVNDVVSCVGTKGPLDRCLERMQVSSRAKTELIK